MAEHWADDVDLRFSPVEIRKWKRARKRELKRMSGSWQGRVRERERRRKAAAEKALVREKRERDAEEHARLAKRRVPYSSQAEAFDAEQIVKVTCSVESKEAIRIISKTGQNVAWCRKRQLQQLVPLLTDAGFRLRSCDFSLLHDFRKYGMSVPARKECVVGGKKRPCDVNTAGQVQCGAVIFSSGCPATREIGQRCKVCGLVGNSSTFSEGAYVPEMCTSNGRKRSKEKRRARVHQIVMEALATVPPGRGSSASNIYLPRFASSRSFYWKKKMGKMAHKNGELPLENNLHELNKPNGISTETGVLLAAKRLADLRQSREDEAQRRYLKKTQQLETTLADDCHIILGSESLLSEARPIIDCDFDEKRRGCLIEGVSRHTILSPEEARQMNRWRIELASAVANRLKIQ